MLGTLVAGVILGIIVGLVLRRNNLGCVAGVVLGGRLGRVLPKELDEVGVDGGRGIEIERNLF